MAGNERQFAGKFAASSASKNATLRVGAVKAEPESAWTADDRSAAVEAVLTGMTEGRTLAQTVEALAGLWERGLTPGAVRRWIVADAAAWERYQRTKGMLGQAFADEAVQVARDSTSSTTAIDRVLIETLKWAAAKANPAEFGEKQTVEHQGAQTLSVRIVEDDAKPLRDDRLPVESAVLAQVAIGTTLTLPAPTRAVDDGEGAAD